MRWILIILVVPVTVFAQDFTREVTAFPVEQEGRFLPAPWTGGSNRITPHFVDIDADGDYDLFYGDGRGRVGHYLNTGTPFQPEYTFITEYFDSILTQSIHPGYYSWGCSDVEFCDIDADGDQDMFFAGYHDGIGSLIFFYENIGDSCNFIPQLADSFFAGIQRDCTNIRIDFCDIDADDDYDLFFVPQSITATLGQIFFYQNIGTPQSPNYVFISDSFAGIDIDASIDPHFVDYDGDGDFDLFIGIGHDIYSTIAINGTIMYYENIGTPWQWDYRLVSAYFDSILVQDYASPFLVDIDNDSDLDLFVGRGGTNPSDNPRGNIGGNLFFYRNIGTRTNPEYQHVTKNYLTIDVSLASNPRFCDIDADGDQDLFITHLHNHIVFYRNIGTPTDASFILESEQYQGIEVGYGVQMDFADLDSDSDYDLVISSDSYGFSYTDVYQNTGSPDSAVFELFQSNIVGMIDEALPRLVDIDDDNDEDLFFADGYGCIRFFENRGDSIRPDFVFVTSTYMNIDLSSIINLAFVDYDEDADYDMFIGLLNGYIAYYMNTGSPSNAEFILIDSTFQDLRILNVGRPNFCDIDSDNDPDLFIGDAGGGVWFYRNNRLNHITRHRQTNQASSFTLQQNYPNPFNAVTTIPLTLERALPVRVVVYNQLGQRVETLFEGKMAKGEHIIQWDGARYGSGVYYISLGDETGMRGARKVLLVK